MIIKLKFKDTDKYFIYTIKWDVRKIEINNFHYKISPSTSITKFYLWPEHLLPIFTLGNGCFITWLWVEISKKYGKCEISLLQGNEEVKITSKLVRDLYNNWENNELIKNYL